MSFISQLDAPAFQIHGKHLWIRTQSISCSYYAHKYYFVFNLLARQWCIKDQEYYVMAF